MNVRNTGATKQVSGVDANESILTMEMIGTNTTNGQQGAFAITNDMWMAPEIPGYDELREFQKKLAVKLGDAFSGSGLSATLAAMQPAAAQGMSDMVKEMSKLKGIPVEQIIAWAPRRMESLCPQPVKLRCRPAPSGPEMPSAKDVAQQSASSAIASKLGGFGIGGFGGFGHKKQAPPPPPADDSSNYDAADSHRDCADGIENGDCPAFRRAPIDSGSLPCPAGSLEIPPRSHGEIELCRLLLGLIRGRAFELIAIPDVAA